MIAIQIETLEHLLKKVDEISTKLDSQHKQPKEIWLDNEEFIQHLKISKRLAQTYRDNGMISFSQIGSKIYYKLSDVESLLNSHYIKGHKRGAK